MPPTSELADDASPAAGLAPALTPVPPGSRIEQLLMIGKLLADLASIPFHLALFVFTRGRHKRRFAEALAAAGVSGRSAVRGEEPATQRGEAGDAARDEVPS